jgi:hypothetical protein
MEYNSGIKKNEIMMYEGKWMELENIVSSEVSQVQKDKGLMFSVICGRYIQKINVYMKQTWSYIYLYKNSRTILWNLGEERGEKRIIVNNFEKYCFCIGR